MLNITDKAVSKWERDIACPDTMTIPKLAEILGISVEELMNAKSVPTTGHKGAGYLLSIILKAVPLAMGVAVVVTSLLGELDMQSGFVMLGIGLVCVGIYLLKHMVIKLKANQEELLGMLIRQIEAMQNRTSRNQERIRQIDKEIADLGAKNLVITRLHTSGVLGAADYSKQTSEISNRITDLRIERRKKLTEDEDDELLDTIKELNGILEEYEPTTEFDNDLFEQIVQSITVNDNTQITFRLLGNIELTEEINEKGRCKSA